MDPTTISASLLLMMAAMLPLTVTGSSDFDAAFWRFLDDHGYSGGSVAALKDGRLVAARGFGVTPEGRPVRAEARLPVTRVSHSITAVAVLTLVQRGLLALDDKVFGKEGLLHMVDPIRERRADPRLSEITVGHLMNHSAGWDRTKPPLYDPVLNGVYLSRGRPAVENIAEAMDVEEPLDALSLIRYVISQPLHFRPGTRQVFSNFAYLVLGRVIEQASQMMYEDYVKRAVLNPCGMWRTRLWLPEDTQGGQRTVLRMADMAEDMEEVEDEDDEDVRKDGILGVLDPLSVDSALGWASTAVDMARFARCVFDDDFLLNDNSLEALLQDAPPSEEMSEGKAEGEEAPHVRKHHGGALLPGFWTDGHGQVWQDGDPQGDDVIVFHNLHSGRVDDDEEGEGWQPDSWAVTLHGTHVPHLRHKVAPLLSMLRESHSDLAVTARAMPDLSDIDADKMDDEVLVKLGVDEHHLDAYVAAVTRDGYDVTWVFPYTHHARHTSFIVIARFRGGEAKELRLEHGLSEKQLLLRKLAQERHGFNLTFLQAYTSHSHHQDNGQPKLSFLALFRRFAYPEGAQLKYGTQHLREPYDRLVQMYREQHFQPLAQTVMPSNDFQEEQLSFVFLHTPGAEPLDFVNAYGLNATQLDDAVRSNAKKGRTLAFLDSYRLEDQHETRAGSARKTVKPRKAARFAAVFSNATSEAWTWEGGLGPQEAMDAIVAGAPRGLFPAMAVAYTDAAKRQRFSLYLRADPQAES